MHSAKEDSNYVSKLCLLMEQRLPIHEGMELVRKIEEMQDDDLIRDYLFLLDYYDKDRVRSGVPQALRERMLKNSFCPSQKLLLEHVLGRLEGRKVDTYVAAHVATCSHCREYTKRERKTVLRRTMEKLLAGLQGNAKPSFVERLRERMETAIEGEKDGATGK